MSYKLASSTWDESEIHAMQEVIASGNFTMGQRVKEYETAFAEFFGSKYAVMSNSGSSANLLAVAAMRYRSDFNSLKTDIIVPAVSWSTTFYPVHQLGFRLKFVDIDLHTLNASADAIAEAIDEKTAGIFAVNLLGNPSELDVIRKLADRNNIFFLEDNCESMGAILAEKFAGTFGDIGTFSTFFSHHISTMEGGMCLTDNVELAQILISIRAHGWTRELPDQNFIFNKTGGQFEDHFRFVLPGYNLRPLELEAAIGIEQLRKLPEFLNERQKNSEIFRHRFSKYGEYLQIQKENGNSSWFGFSLMLKGMRKNDRPKLIEVLQRHKIETRPIVAGAFHKNPVMKHLNHAPLGDLSNAEALDQRGLFIGNHHTSLEGEFDILESALTEFCPLKVANS